MISYSVKFELEKYIPNQFLLNPAFPRRLYPTDIKIGNAIIPNNANIIILSVVNHNVDSITTDITITAP